MVLTGHMETSITLGYRRVAAWAAFCLLKYSLCLTKLWIAMLTETLFFAACSVKVPRYLASEAHGEVTVMAVNSRIIFVDGMVDGAATARSEAVSKVSICRHNAPSKLVVISMASCQFQMAGKSVAYTCN